MDAPPENVNDRGRLGSEHREVRDAARREGCHHPTKTRGQVVKEGVGIRQRLKERARSAVEKVDDARPSARLGPVVLPRRADCNCWDSTASEIAEGSNLSTKVVVVERPARAWVIENAKDAPSDAIQHEHPALILPSKDVLQRH